MGCQIIPHMEGWARDEHTKAEFEYSLSSPIYNREGTKLNQYEVGPKQTTGDHLAVCI